MLLASDHSLQFAGSGLKDFQREPLKAPAPLLPAWRRYQAKWAGPFDDERPADARAAAAKFVIQDTCAKQSWYELQAFPGGGVNHPCLAVLTGEGSDNMAGSAFAMSKLMMRIIWCFDRLHRVINDMKLSLGAAGLWPLVQELLHVLNTNRAPWVTKAFFKERRESFDHFASTCSTYRRRHLPGFAGPLGQGQGCAVRPAA